MSNKYNPSKSEDEEFIPGEVTPQNKDTQSALSQYKTGTELENIYNSAIGELDANREADKRSAYFNNEKLMKYLPNSMKVQGLQNNVGAMNQAYIDANNAYQNNLNTINRDYNSQKAELTNELNMQKYQEQQTASKELLDARAQQLSTYASTLDVGENGTYSSENIAKLKSYVEENNLYEGLTETDRKLLDSALAGYTQMSEQEEADYTKEKKENNIKTIAVSQYGVAEDAVGIDNSTADVYSFGKFAGTGKGSSDQDKYVKWIINSSFKDGTIVDFNWGAGSSANYIYIGGYWFPTNKNATVNYNDYKVKHGMSFWA